MSVCDQMKPFPFAPYVFVTEETTVDDLRRYLRDIKACGFDCIRFGGGEGGCGAKHLGEDRYDFRHTDMIFDLADEAGLKIIPNLRVGYVDWMAQPPHNVPRTTHLIEDEYHRLNTKYATVVAERYRHRQCLLALTTGAEVTAQFDDGRPAAVRNQVGKGEVVYFACEVASRCFRNGPAFEEMLAAAVLKNIAPLPWSCEGAVAFRRRHGQVDHWFLINRDEKHGAEIRVADVRYRSVADVMREREVVVEAGGSIRVPAGLGCWLRAER